MPRGPWPSNLTGWWHAMSRSPIKLHGPPTTWFCEVMWQINYFISPLYWTNDHQTRQGGDLLWGASSLNSLNTLKMCSCEVTWQIINVIASLSQCLLSSKLPGWWHTTRNSHPKIHMTFQCCFLRLRDKLTYLYFQRTHWQQNGQGTDLPWEVPNIIATWLFDHVTSTRSRDNLKNLNLHLHKTYGH